MYRGLMSAPPSQCGIRQEAPYSPRIQAFEQAYVSSGLSTGEHDGELSRLPLSPLIRCVSAAAPRATDGTPIAIRSRATRAYAGGRCLSTTGRLPGQLWCSMRRLVGRADADGLSPQPRMTTADDMSGFRPTIKNETPKNGPWRQGAAMALPLPIFHWASQP